MKLKALDEFPLQERNRLRWLLREAATNGIVESGTAVKYGRRWFVDETRLPEFLRQKTLSDLRQRDTL